MLKADKNFRQIGKRERQGKLQTSQEESKANNCNEEKKGYGTNVHRPA